MEGESLLGCEVSIGVTRQDPSFPFVNFSEPRGDSGEKYDRRARTSGARRVGPYFWARGLGLRAEGWRDCRKRADRRLSPARPRDFFRSGERGTPRVPRPPRKTE